jgi:hypothetical protein
MAGAIHPKEVNMRSPKTMLLVFALAAIALTAWAGDNAATDSPKSNSDNKTVGVQAQPAKDEEKPDQATQSKPRNEQAPRSEDKGVQTPERRSDNAQPARSEPSSARPPQYRSEPAQAPASIERQEPSYTEPARIQTRQSDRAPSDFGEINVPQPGSEPNRGGRRGGSGGYRGGRDHDPFDRRPSHYFGGRGWHGRHDEWRHRHYHGSWRFLFYLGPTIYYPPIHYPHIIRIPHDRVGVYVRYAGDDAVGSAFANSVREHLRDEGLRVVYSQDDARLELYVISMEQDPDEPGYNSSISVSYVWYPGHKFITAQMVDAGLNQVDDLAASVAAYADELVDDYR